MGDIHGSEHGVSPLVRFGAIYTHAERQLHVRWYRIE